MGVGSWLKGLFDGDSAPAAAADPVLHKGFEIYPEPQAQGGQFQVRGRIVKRDGDSVREHLFIRADMISTSEEASQIMVAKAQTFIDQMGESIFD